MDDDDFTPYFYDPTRNEALMCAIGRLVVRSAELDETVVQVIKRSCDDKTKKQLRKTMMLRRKLEMLKSIAEQVSAAMPIGHELSRFASDCIESLDGRNSPVHSTYLIDNDGIVKWDLGQEPEPITPELIEKSAQALHRLERKGRGLSGDLLTLRNRGYLTGELAPSSRLQR